MCYMQVRTRTPLFDQMILNRYTPGEGLKLHTDLARFADGICIVSTGSCAALDFVHAQTGASHKVLTTFTIGSSDRCFCHKFSQCKLVGPV